MNRILWKPALFLTPTILAVTACDAPPAEDPAGEGLEDGSTMDVTPMEEPIDTGPLDQTVPVDGGLEGGGAPADDLSQDVPDTVAPAGEGNVTEENVEEPSTTSAEDSTAKE
ncbi:MAG: hypothetical protein ABJO01_11120 [Parasphingorhabdus sp.]|uniref:hypothetical protein n=1 Tax=Parasphingorhabdus sp. TaxID=2709688 RepID=UPI00329857DA